MLRPLGVHVCLRVAQLSLAQTELERGVALRTRALAAVVTAWPYRGQVRGDGATMWMEKRSDHGEMSERFLESMTSQGRRHAPGDDGGLGPTVRRFVALPGLRRHPPPHRLDDLAHTRGSGGGASTGGGNGGGGGGGASIGDTAVAAMVLIVAMVMDIGAGVHFGLR